MKRSCPRQAGALVNVVVLLLIAAVAVQGYFLFQMNQRLATPPTEDAAPTHKPLIPFLGPKTPPPTAAPIPPPPSGHHPPPFARGLSGGTLDPFDPNWDPFAEMERMREEMDRIFADAFGRFGGPQGRAFPRGPQAMMPDMDFTDEGPRYVVRMNLPGADKSKINVNLNDRLLTVSGDINEQLEEKEGQQVFRRERRTGHFQRSFTLPGPVDSAGMQADFDKGVLTITIPKDSQPRQTLDLKVI